MDKLMIGTLYLFDLLSLSFDLVIVESFLCGGKSQYLINSAETDASYAATELTHLARISFSRFVKIHSVTKYEKLGPSKKF